MNTITTNREGYDSKKSERKNSGEHSTIEKGIQELAEAYYSGKRENPRNKKPKLDIESAGLSSIHNMKRNDYEYENEESFMEYFESSKHDLSRDMNKNVDLDIMEELVRLAMENGAVFLFQCLKVGDDIMKLKQSNEDVQQYEGVLECIKSDFLNIDKELMVYYDLSPLDQKHTLQPDVVLGFKSKHRKIVKILSGLEKRLQFLKKSIANHYVNKEQESQRQKIRMEISAKKEEQKKNKMELQAQEQGKMEEKQDFVQESVDISSIKKETKIAHLIDKKTTRVNNLLNSSKKGKLTPQQLAEIGKIENDIKEIEVNNESIQEKISGIQDVINQIYLNLERALQSNNIQDAALIKNIQDSRENTRTFPKDEQLITYFNSILNTFNHSLSSTKHKDSSYADGSFTMNVFRPFIHSILNEILEKGKIDTRNGISWAKLIEIFENNCDDMDKARMHFRGILKKYNTIATDYYTLFFDLSMAIDEFTDANFFSRQNGNELNNFSDKYEKFMETIQ